MWVYGLHEVLVCNMVQGVTLFISLTFVQTGVEVFEEAGAYLQTGTRMNEEAAPT